MLGIILLNYNTWKDLEKCIKSIKVTNRCLNYCIYVVDNMSPNKIPQNLELYLNNSGVKLIFNKENKGFASGNNVGIKRALDDGCDQILVSNTDVIYHDKSIETLSSYLRNNKEVGIVGPKIYTIDGNFQGMGRFYKTTLKEKYLIHTPLRYFFKKKREKFYGLNLNYNEIQTVHNVSGCCFMMSRECAEDITPLDENTFLYQEEIIIGLRMTEKGYLTHYVPTSTITHLEGQSTKDEMSAFSFTKLVKSEIYYCKTYLKANNIQIFPLYVIRTLSYLYRAIDNTNYRKGFIEYLNSTYDSFRAGN